MKVTLNYHYKDLKKEVEMKKKNVHVKRQISAFKEDAWFFLFLFPKPQRMSFTASCSFIITVYVFLYINMKGIWI